MKSSRMFGYRVLHFRTMKGRGFRCDITSGSYGYEYYRIFY